MPVAVQKLDAPTVRETSGGGYAPLIRCDACRKEITTPEEGRIAWRPDENVTVLSVSFLHAGCVDENGRRDPHDWRVATLGDFVEGLGRFLGEAGA